VEHRRQRDDWETPPELLAAVIKRYGQFSLDPAATAENAKAPAFFTPVEDGLAQRWFGQVWLNPPYSQTRRWMAKCVAECEARNVRRIVALVAARTDTRWFHETLATPFVEEIVALRGRVRFVGAEHSAPFPSLLLVLAPPPWISAPPHPRVRLWDWRRDRMT
jgi:phage N-6-adenine-methyltransferase